MILLVWITLKNTSRLHARTRPHWRFSKTVSYLRFSIGPLLVSRPSVVGDLLSTQSLLDQSGSSDSVSAETCRYVAD